MGLHNLTIVAPNLMSTPMTGQPPVFNPESPQDFQLPEESFILASGAADVLHNAVIAATLDEALADTTLACALPAAAAKSPPRCKPRANWFPNYCRRRGAANKLPSSSATKPLA